MSPVLSTGPQSVEGRSSAPRDSGLDPILVKPYVNPVISKLAVPTTHLVPRSAAVMPSLSFKSVKKTVSNLPDELEVDEQSEVDDEDVFDVANRKQDTCGEERAIARVAAWTTASALPRIRSKSGQTSLCEEREEPEVVDSDSDKEDEGESEESAGEGGDEDYMPVSEKE
jgi:hypothetical protein